MEIDFTYFEKLKTVSWRKLLVTFAIAFALASMLAVASSWLIMPLATKDVKISKISVVKLEKERATLDDGRIKTIVSRNIFNIEGKTGDDKDRKNDPAVENIIVKSTLPFTLMGTIFSGDPFSGIALIKDNTSSSLNSFFVGDKLGSEARVLEIHREKIILQVADHKEFMVVESAELARKSRRKQQKTEGKETKSGYALEPPPDTYKEEGFERSGNSMVVSSDFRRKILTTDFAKVLQDAKAEPYLVGNELAGFRLTKIRQDSIYQKAGLQNGDVVKEINGVSLVDTGQAIKLLNSLRGENEISVRLERDGATVTMNMQIK